MPGMRWRAGSKGPLGSLGAIYVGIRAPFSVDPKRIDLGRPLTRAAGRLMHD